LNDTTEPTEHIEMQVKLRNSSCVQQSWIISVESVILRSSFGTIEYLNI